MSFDTLWKAIKNSVAGGKAVSGEASAGRSGGDHSPFGVPLDDIARIYEATAGCRARFSGSRLIVRGEDPQADTTIEVTAPPAGSPAEVACFIVVKTPALYLKELIRDEEALSLLNQFAAGGSLISDGRNPPYVGSRFAYFKSDNAWRDVQKPLIAAASFQGSVPIGKSFVGMLTGEAPEASGRPAWGRQDFEFIADTLQPHMVCTTGDDGLTAEAVLEGPGTTALEGAVTALIQLQCSMHPCLGPGLMALLSMPENFGAPRLCYEKAARLNALEMEGVDTAYHFGAWCSQHGTTLSYVSFFPNDLKRNGSLAINWPFVLGARARWAHRLLQAGL